MTTRSLRIAEDLRLPLDWMTLATIVYGARGSGKTTLGAVIAEEITKAGQRFCAIDLKGDWYGLKSSADGTAEGIPAIIFGGDHKDVPLEEGAGAEVGEIVAGLEQSAILDLEYFSKGKQIRFLAAFFERLYDRNREPLVLLLDEAQRYAPQKPWSPESLVCLGMVEDLVKLGRKHGIGPVLFTQRGSGLNKEVSELCDLLVAFRTPGPLDQDRIKDWLDANTTKQQRDQVMGQLSGLATGTAVFASGHPDLKTFQVAHVRRRETFDSSATPKVGQRRKEPRRLAKPDLEALHARMSAAIERAKQEDPKELRRQIAELQREARKGKPAPAAAARVVEKQIEKRVEVPVLKDAQLKRLEAVSTKLVQFGERVVTVGQDVVVVGREITASLARLGQDGNGGARHSAPVSPAPAARMPSARPAPQPRPRSPAPAPFVEGDFKPSSLQQRILNAVRFLESIGVPSPSRPQAGFVAGARFTTGHFKNELGGLNSGRLVRYPRPGYVELTDQGRALATLENVPQTTEELQDQVLGMLSGAQHKMLEYLIAVYPEAISREDLGLNTGLESSTGHFKNELGGLRTMGVVDYPQPGWVEALPVLFLEER